MYLCLFLLYCSLYPLINEGKRLPDTVESISPLSHTDISHQSCSDSKDCNNCEETCSWSVPNNIRLQYSLIELCHKELESKLLNPQGAIITISPCNELQCGNNRAKGCITVPGVKPTITGRASSIRLIEPGVPSYGFELVFSDGDTCEVTGKPRETIVTLPCDPEKKYTNDITAVKTFEGEKKEICHYYIVFPPTQLGCPTNRHVSMVTDSSHPITIDAVSGCVDSDPVRTTSNCLSDGEQTLTIHGTIFSSLCPDYSTHNADHCTGHIEKNYCVFIGNNECTHVTFKNMFKLTCIFGRSHGNDLPVKITKRIGSGSHSSANGHCVTQDVVAEMSNAVSFKETVNYRLVFDQFVQYGVGGLKKQIDELYRRAFASRGVSSELLGQLGITHVKGILLYGPPGTGKTLLARTIAKALGTSQVQLINGPEVISKYLGESERNLRGYFDEAHKSFQKHGESSDLYVIVIDEIDAICKPRGKSDHSAASVAYDSLVNQLLTLMDGLSEVSNVLVIGMTNRRELMDSALLRPGRFEVQIEFSLPDEAGREEIFSIHTRNMRNNGLLGKDISLMELAVNTTGYSGAEIAGCVRAASSYALDRQQSSTGHDSTFSVQVRKEDFQKAITTITPAHTHSESVISAQFLPPVFLHLGNSHERVITSLLDLAQSLQFSSYNRLQSVLLYGPKVFDLSVRDGHTIGTAQPLLKRCPHFIGRLRYHVAMTLERTGKTSLAAQIALIGKFKLVKIITASSIVEYADMQKVDVIKQAFSDAMKVASALIVLDDLHRLLEYINIGTQLSVSRSMMHVITTMLSMTPPTTSRLLVIGTITVDNRGDLFHESNSLGLYNMFSWHYMVPPMDLSAMIGFMNSKQLVRKDNSQSLSIPKQFHNGIPVRQLIQGLECAVSDRDNSDSLTHIDQKQFNNCLVTILSTSVSHDDDDLVNVFPSH